MVYYFDLADEPDCTLGSSNAYMGQYAWFSAVPVKQRDGIAEDWMLEFYPTIVTVVPDECKLHDILKTQGMYTISSRLKDIIEKLEPNIHQFIPVTVHYGPENHPYYILKFGISEDCYDLDRSDIEWKDIPAGEGKTLRVWRKKYKVPLVFISDKIKGKHLWQNASGNDMKLMSGELHDACIRNNITGIKFEEQIVAAE